MVNDEPIFVDEKKTSESMLLKYQERLNFWGENAFEQCNPLARCGVFSVAKIKDNFLKDFETFRVVGDGNVQYQGWRLSVFDEEVFLLLISYMQGQSLLKPLANIKRSQILKDLDLSICGKNYKTLDESLKRLYSGSLKISSKSALQRILMILTKTQVNKLFDAQFLCELENRYGAYIKAIENALQFDDEFYISIRFFSNMAETPKSKEVIISLDPLMVLFFDGINTTRMDRYERKLLAPAEQRLLGFTQSHSKGIYDLNLISYAEIIGSNTDFDNPSSVRRFRSNMRKWLTTLEQIKRIKPGWEINNKSGKVIGVKPIPYAQ